MHYVGGKQKNGGSKIAPLVAKFCKRYSPGFVVEPFCGGLSVTYRLVKLGINVSASDLCEPLITLYKALQNGWQAPEVVSREVWEAYKANPDPNDPMTAFVGFGCSHAGAYFSSFSEKYKYTKRYVDTATAAKNSLAKKLADCGSNVVFSCIDYRDAPTNAVWYCDIPYAGTLGYPAVGDFDHESFWNHARSVSEKVPVLVSERIAPGDFLPLESWSVQMRFNNTKQENRRSEHLFIHERWADKA